MVDVVNETPINMMLILTKQKPIYYYISFSVSLLSLYNTSWILQ